MGFGYILPPWACAWAWLLGVDCWLLVVGCRLLVAGLGVGVHLTPLGLRMGLAVGTFLYEIHWFLHEIQKLEVYWWWLEGQNLILKDVGEICWVAELVAEEYDSS